MQMLNRMMIMYLSMLLIFFIGANRSLAQPRMDVDKQLENLKDRLKLNDEQTTKIKSILVQADSERVKLFELNQDDRDAMRAAMRDLRDDTDRQINEVLTDDQKAEYKKMKEERRNEWRRHGPPDGSRLPQDGSHPQDQQPKD
jgi:Spy/CpxP family protein refolding chaperone